MKHVGGGVLPDPQATDVAPLAIYKRHKLNLHLNALFLLVLHLSIVAASMLINVAGFMRHFVGDGEDVQVIGITIRVPSGMMGRGGGIYEGAGIGRALLNLMRSAHDVVVPMRRSSSEQLKAGFHPDLKRL